MLDIIRTHFRNKHLVYWLQNWQIKCKKITVLNLDANPVDEFSLKMAVLWTAD